jgi:hypothetical protein
VNYHRLSAVLHEGCCYRITPSPSVKFNLLDQVPLCSARKKYTIYLKVEETDPFTFLSSQQHGGAKLWRSVGGGGRKFCRSVLVRAVGWWWVVQAAGLSHSARKARV